MIPNSPDAIEYSRAISARLKKYVPMLKEYMGITCFLYARNYFDNTTIHATNDDSLTEGIIKTFSDVPVFYQRLLNGLQQKYFVLWPEVPKHYSMECLVKHGYWNGSSLIVEHDSCLEFFAFATDSNHNRIKESYIKNRKELIRFIEYFARENEDVLSERKTRDLFRFENNMDFSILNDIKSDAKDEQMRVEKFFKSLGYDVLSNLSYQEHRCTELLAQGRTMKEIARALGISPRTVESYIESIKNKTGCNYKSQIIDLYYNNNLLTQ